MFGSAAVMSTTGTDSLFLPEADDLADPLPGILWIELTSKCPFDCVFCSRQLRRGTGEHMDFRLFQALIGQLRRDAWKERLTGVARKLRGFVSLDGAVAFDRRKERDRPHWNAWSAMFACQAFLFWETCLSGKSVEPRLIRLLV